jgi:phosphopantothenoylcysteine synthetase/decarboxylase
MARLCTLVVCGAPLAHRTADIVAELRAVGWTTQVVLTPAAAAWVKDDDVLPGLDVRVVQRAADAPKRRERPEVVVIAPATFNTVGKLAHGIADTLAHSTLCEALGARVPILAVPMVNDKLWGHPALHQNFKTLSTAGVRWVSMLDGTVGEPEPVQSGTGDDLVKGFSPEWITGHLPLPS